MKYDLKQLLHNADKRKYAIPAFNFSDCWDLKAIVEAAKEENSPVIVASAKQVISTFSADYLGAICEIITNAADTPVIFHVDHSTDADLCITMAKCGYPSVMIDGSLLKLDDNIAVTKKVVDHVKYLNVCVEAEIGRIRGRNDEACYKGQEFLGSVDDAVKLIQATGADSLAVGLGNAHGFYQGKPKLNFQRLQEVNEAIDIPLVLHGGTGIPPEDIMTAIKNGINKVNVGTELHYVYLKQLAEQLDRNNIHPNIIEQMDMVVDAVKVPVKRWIRICMANGKA